MALRSAAVFALGGAFQRALMFLLLPVFTRVLSPAEYGRLSIALAVTGAAYIVFGFSLDVSVFRSYFQLSDDRGRQEQFIRTVWTFTLTVPIALATVIGVLALPVVSASGVFGPTDVLLSLLAAALLVGASTVPLSLLRAQRRLRDFLTLTIGGAVVNVTAILIAVLGLRAGVTGWLVAVVLANAFLVVIALRVVPFSRSERFDPRMLREALRFSLPIIPHYVAHWSLQLADRLVLAAVTTASAVGVYSLAANLALPAMVAVQSLNQGFMPFFARAGKTSDELPNLTRMIRVQVALVCMLTLAGCALAGPAVHLIASPEYWGAASLTPWIVLGYGFMGLYLILMNGITLTLGRTDRIWMITVVSAGVNLSAVAFLVPVFGLEAAAVAAAAGYGVLLAGVLAHSFRVGNPVGHPWGMIAAAILVSAAGYIGATLTAGDETVLEACIRVAWVGVACLVILYLSGALRRLTPWGR